MKIKFNDGTEKTIVNNPVEQRLLKNGEPVGWLMHMSISPVEAPETTSLLSKENISKITLLTENEDVRTVIEGYDTVTSLTIRHTDTQTVAEIQFAKSV